ncbi:MYXO-CTERM sorting domain-containing protein [Nannocystis radixulma]|uniref:MYXO-CTERM sorting domain-containing protein n=1 Tax=Nannocystis radixulma TaxID=2995305 RepID=A0ABT5BN69_9BACT|nr:MYXO-CTERM sorting domain-containing protein [Nannocystis radixulma]MDC0675537.1 MYXO-CTERM sorting domain-containing protein [Nannocystis radixulma]
MNLALRALTVAALGLCSLAPTVASASFPAGVWALVEKVTTEPDDKNPNRVRIDGLFMVANQKPDFAKYTGYSVPAHGHMYYECPEQDLATCQMEWAELAKLAGGEDNCRGWGDNSLPDNGSVRTAEPPVKPDAYPLSMGVLVGFTPCDALRAWQVEHPPQGATTGEGTSDGTSEGGSSGEFASESGAPATTSGAETGEAATASPTSDGPNPEATGTAGETAEGGASDSASGGSNEGEKGCVCSSSGEPRPLASLAALLGLLALRRRRAA